MPALLTIVGCIGVLSIAAPAVGQQDEADWVEVRKILASDGGGRALFGRTAAIDGDRLAVGAPRAAPGDTGAVYVFERHAGGPSRWGEVARLKPLDPVLADLGAEVAIHGDTIAASAPTEGEGAAYVFERRPDGTWKRTRLLPPGEMCEGMELGLEEPRVLSAVPADGDGRLSLTRTVGPGACERFLQAVEVGICNPSNTARVP